MLGIFSLTAFAPVSRNSCILIFWSFVYCGFRGAFTRSILVAMVWIMGQLRSSRKIAKKHQIAPFLEIYRRENASSKAKHVNIVYNATGLKLADIFNYVLNDKLPLNTTEIYVKYVRMPLAKIMIELNFISFHTFWYELLNMRTFSVPLTSSQH